MLRAISLGLVLAATWLLLSGHYEALIIGFGVISCVAVVLVARGMGVLDREGHPMHLTVRAPVYWIWLSWEIVKANIDVARRILHPRLPISPTVVTVPSTQGTQLGQVIYANSITLTPGTVTLQVDKDSIEVHALTADAARELQDGAMDRRVTAMESRTTAEGAS